MRALSRAHRLPHRETTETLYLLGEERSHCRHLRLHRAAAAGAPRKAEGVAFPSAKSDKILQLKPDL